MGSLIYWLAFGVNRSNVKVTAGEKTYTIYLQLLEVISPKLSHVCTSA